MYLVLIALPKSNEAFPSRLLTSHVVAFRIPSSKSNSRLRPPSSAIYVLLVLLVPDHRIRSKHDNWKQAEQTGSRARGILDIALV